jgi:hypothetical protein
LDIISIKESSLRKIIKESVKEAIIEERMNLYELLLYSVSKKELHDIEKRYNKPSDYTKTDFKDMTDWVMK